MSYYPLTVSLTEIITRHTYNGVYYEQALDTFTVPYIELKSTKNDVRERLTARLNGSGGKCSNVLIEQMARHKLHLFEKFGNEFHNYHFQTIIDIVGLVDKGLAMNVRPFRNLPLAGMLHVHHNSNTFVAQNMCRYWKAMYGKNNEIDFQNALLEAKYNDLLRDFPADVAQTKLLTVLLNDILMKSRFRKIEEQTGEWVVYAEMNNIKYYLCLATHNEAKEFSDQVIFDRISPCFEEFPELKTKFGV